MYYYDPTPGTINTTVGYTEIVNCSPPIFSEVSGFYESDILLEIAAEQGADIRYTLDSSEPNEKTDANTAYYEFPEVYIEQIHDVEVEMRKETANGVFNLDFLDISLKRVA